MTTKLSLYVCNANTSWIEIAITFSAKSRETPVFLLFFTLLADPNRRPFHTQPHRLLTGSEHRAACGRWSGAMSRKKQRALRRAPRPRWLHITRFRLWRKLIHYAPRPLPPKNVSILGYPHARRLCFWPYASLVRVQHEAKIKNPVERRDFCFVLFNIYHSLNAHDSNEMHLSDIFEKFVLNKAQLNILMIRMWRLLGYVCL